MSQLNTGLNYLESCFWKTQEDSDDIATNQKLDRSSGGSIAVGDIPKRLNCILIAS